MALALEKEEEHLLPVLRRGRFVASSSAEGSRREEEGEKR